MSNNYDGKETTAVTRKMGVALALNELKTYSPKDYKIILNHLEAVFPKDHALSERTGGLGWVPMRYLVEIATKGFFTMGEDRFLDYWTRSTLGHFNSPLLGSTLTYLMRKVKSPIVVMKNVSPLWALSAKNCGVMSVTSDSDNAATVTLDQVPPELLGKMGYLVGWVGVWRSLLDKCGAKDVRVKREERAGKFTYACTWK